ncbi:hypothetical protein CAI21_04380 [Alkalilimnicola ehrlichii]|uniref:Lipid/polyisoprenoid-binding YceI-like domain-containing protein n=1 Tax=Alkalilimnicola ehrlichii TaxID=351052 RepID=A0A3E0X1H7_9GAMM|nr:YceI family protein [Alkalilimnicola ehrlichii]RFA30751.1 hypothetical protein CAI21_04380 [Alkalilimnicola ehrlichii]RFA38327.1 hypothetical protein CAL65_05745 [Alkalilimnicola ehrlichii]
MRKTQLFSALALAGGLALSNSAFAEVKEYKVDPTHSFVMFSISHLGFSFVEGRFNELSGEFTYDSDNPANSDITMRVNTASIDSNHAERDRHLRASDYLHVSRHPEATFTTTRFEPNGDDGILHGDLTLYGTTQPIEVDVKFVGAGEDPWGGYRRGYVGTTTITLSDFGMNFQLGPDAETTDLRFVIEGIRQ